MKRNGKIWRHSSGLLRKSNLNWFTLLLSRMKEDIVKGIKQAEWRKILAREDIWKRTDAQKQLEWARIAQMNGDVETALNVFTHINHARPDLKDAWIERLELLLILGRRDEMAAIVAASREHVGDETYASWLKLCGKPEGEGSHEAVLSDVATPFVELHRRREAVEHFMTLFSGREDCFARQWVDKKEGKQGYVPVRRPLEPEDVEEHLKGRKTYGIYLMKSDATVRVAVIDVDIQKRFRDRKLKSDDMLKNDAFAFKGRNRRPPLDPVNAQQKGLERIRL